MKKTVLLSLLLGVLLAMTFCLSGCGKQDETADADDLSATGAAVVCPLDGEKIESSDDHGDYVLIVSIDNGADAEPQSGIGQADLLIEMPVEGGINRFMAFFYHNMAEDIGPVRSARHYYYDIVNGYDAVMCHCGGSPMAYDVIDAGGVKDIDEIGCSAPFHRIKDRKAPHNLYTSYATLSEEAANRNYDTVSINDCPSFAFYSEDEQQELTYGGIADFTIPYRYKEVSYKWDESNMNYQRYSKGNLHKDAATDAAVTADNVVVLYVEESIYPETTEHLEIHFNAGDGLVLQNGAVTKISWSLSDGKGFTFTDAESGSEVKLIPGKTIIQIADTTETAKYTEPAAENGAEE